MLLSSSTSQRVSSIALSFATWNYECTYRWIQWLSDRTAICLSSYCNTSIKFHRDTSGSLYTRTRILHWITSQRNLFPSPNISSVVGRDKKLPSSSSFDRQPSLSLFFVFFSSSLNDSRACASMRARFYLLLGMSLCAVVIYGFFSVVDQHSCMLLLRSHIEFHSANALRFSLSLSLPIRSNPYILRQRLREEERRRKRRRRKENKTKEKKKLEERRDTKMSLLYLTRVKRLRKDNKLKH